MMAQLVLPLKSETDFHEHIRPADATLMNINILGACGGIGAQAQTMSLLEDRDILIDADIRAGEMTLPELRAIYHVFLSYSTLDHLTMAGKYLGCNIK